MPRQMRSPGMTSLIQDWNIVQHGIEPQLIDHSLRRSYEYLRRMSCAGFPLEGSGDVQRCENGGESLFKIGKTRTDEAESRGGEDQEGTNQGEMGRD
jgi:hypothetical protein